LISAAKVAGTAMYKIQGDRLSQDPMLDKRTGKTVYALMSSVDFLASERYHPLLWAALKYDTGQACYLVSLTINQLQKAPITAPMKSFC
jgi:hypothetical protein